LKEEKKYIFSDIQNKIIDVEILKNTKYNIFSENKNIIKFSEIDQDFSFSDLTNQEKNDIDKLESN
jgi:hypothetical protein